MRGARLAQQHFYNTASGPGSLCDDLTKIVDAYDWIINDLWGASGLTDEVRTVNESYGCDGVGTESSIIDYYSSTYDLLIVKAGGNDVEEPSCGDALNPLCVGYAFDAVGGGNTRISDPSADLEVSCGSAVANNPSHPGREEPDLVAVGGVGSGCAGSTFQTTLAAGMGSQDCHAEFGGSSAAAPSVTAMALLMREWCRPRALSSREMRAMLMNSSWVHNPEEARYSTSNTVTDFTDGAGALDALALRYRCVPDHPEEPLLPGAPSEWDSGEVNIDLSSGDPPPGDVTGYEPGGRMDNDEEPYEYSNPDDGREFHPPLFDGFLPEGGRIRFVVSWDSCSSSGPMVPSASPVDLDLFLFNASTVTWIYGSQSPADVNEGFDVIIPEDGDYQVWGS